MRRLPFSKARGGTGQDGCRNLARPAPPPPQGRERSARQLEEGANDADPGFIARDA